MRTVDRPTRAAPRFVDGRGAEPRGLAHCTLTGGKEARARLIDTEAVVFMQVGAMQAFAPQQAAPLRKNEEAAIA
jgi:hypothetical protein